MKKVFISGSIIEVYEYVGNTCGKGGYQELKDGEQENKNYKASVIRRRNTVRRLVCSNFNCLNAKFLTLTFDDKKVTHDIRNVKESNNEFKKFIKRLKRFLKVKEIKYLAVIEFQDKNGRGAIHYHCVIDIPDIPFLKLQEIWGKGFIFIEDIKHVDNLGAYLVKYMTKENSDKRLQKEKGYLNSHNLDKPYEASDYDLKSFKIFEEKILNKYELEKHEPVYQYEYNTEMLGKCIYTQYNLKR